MLREAHQSRKRDTPEPNVVPNSSRNSLPVRRSRSVLAGIWS